MIFGLALNLHEEVPGPVRFFVHSLMLLAALLVIALLGLPLLRTAWREARRGRLTIEALFALTLCGAMGASLQGYVRGHGSVYFEVISVLLVVYTLAKTIGAQARKRALSEAQVWAGQLEQCRLVDANGESRTIDTDQVMPGDVIEVHPGEMVAVDGVICTGMGLMSEAAVSGEPFAVVRRPGDRVQAGVASYDATFRIEATASGINRHIDHLFEAVDRAIDSPLSLQVRAERIGRAFFPFVALTAIGTFFYWAFLTEHGWEVGLLHAMSVLLVACPCALGLAIPLAVWSAVSRLAERGVIVRSGDAVERLARVDSVLFDKTGTLTEDRFALRDLVTVATGAERAEVIGWLSLVESHSSHPLARPFADLPRHFETHAEPRVTSFLVVPGCGVEATLLEPEGVAHRVQIGTPAWIAAPRPLASSVEGHRIDIAIDGNLAATAVLVERLRGSAQATLKAFHRLGMPVEVLTGDAADHAQRLNLPGVRACLLPGDKREYVESLVRAGQRPMMVGDGINDAAALAAAHVGVALASGTDLAVGSADVTLYHDDLRALPWAVQTSREAVRAVYCSLMFAATYNLVGMTFAACGLLHPVLAAVLMIGSNLTLLFASTRIRNVVDHCRDVEPTPGNGGTVLRALLHASALFGQGVLLLLLLGSPGSSFTAFTVLALYAFVSMVLAQRWVRWAAIPHGLDMCFGMLTFGNLGMFLGWWADNGFAAVHCLACCSCGDPAGRPWMWLGMLAFANFAMLALGRRPLPTTGDHRFAMFTGGNLGMVLGMFVGGVAAEQLQLQSLTSATLGHAVGMTLGMLAGMLFGTRIVEEIYGGLRRVHRSRILTREIVDREPEANRDDRPADVLSR